MAQLTIVTHPDAPHLGRDLGGRADLFAAPIDELQLDPEKQ